MKKPDFKYPLFKVDLPKEVIANLEQVLFSGWIGEGDKVKEFEKYIAGLIDNQLALAVNSCTSALMMSLRLCGIGKDDEVISSPLTCAATNLPILDLGGKIIWADCDKNTGNISPASIEKKITSKTKAIMAIHWGGVPADIDAINEIASRHNLFVIEDAAHALGSVYKGKSVGSHSDFVCFSFQSVKILTAGDGGAICCRNAEMYSKAKKMRWFGIDRDKRDLKRIDDVDIDQIGFKFHMNDISAAIGLSHAARFNEIITARRNSAKFYFENLKNIPGLKLISPVANSNPNYWLFTILTENREGFIKKCLSKGIEVSPVSRRNDELAIFKTHTEKQILENIDYFSSRMICIPNGHWITEEDMDLIVKTIKEGW